VLPSVNGSSLLDVRRAVPEDQGMTARFRVTIAAAIAAALTCWPGTAASAARNPAVVLHSPDWSGYVAVACGSCQLRYVTATWRQPPVNCSASPPAAWADFWAGLDGWTSGSTEQAGVSADCTGGTPHYFAWYDMYPDAPVIWYGVPVAPGNLITASVYHDAATGRWQLTIRDRTAGEAATVSQACPAVIRCDDADAEVITEAPDAGAVVPLADFGAVTYSAIAVTSRDGIRGSMTSNRLQAVHPADLAGAAGTVLASPGPVSGGVTYTDTWHAAQ
jgi:Peptidase A4 family